MSIVLYVYIQRRTRGYTAGISILTITKYFGGDLSTRIYILVYIAILIFQNTTCVLVKMLRISISYFLSYISDIFMQLIPIQFLLGRARVTKKSSYTGMTDQRPLNFPIKSILSWQRRSQSFHLMYLFMLQ